MCITVSRRGKCFCDGQPCATVSVRRMAKRTLKEFIEFQKVSEFQTPHRTRGYGRFSRRPLFASLATALSYSSISLRTSQVSDYLLSFCLGFHFCVSLLALSSSLSSQFLDNETASAATVLGTTNFTYKCKCTHFL